MGGAISQAVHPMTALALAKAVLENASSIIRTVNGSSFQLSRVPDSFGGGYLLSTVPNTDGRRISFEIAPDGVMKTSSSTIECRGLTVYEANPSEQEMLGILRSMHETPRR